MKVKKILAFVLTLCLMVSLFPAVFAAGEADALSFADATKTVLTPKLDGKDIEVTMYEDVYCANPNREEDQKIAIYVPDGATKDSPIIFMVNNSGWQSNAYSGRNGVKSYGTEEGRKGPQIVGDYKSDSDTDAVGKAIAEGYVIVSCGARSRNNGATGDSYLGHSPATMTDTKAAIRYLRYNADLLPAGDVEKIVITGTSGGGALSVVISASGDSADYYPSLAEIGAAGITKNADGTYTDTLSDAVWGTIAYCPITDLGNACAAYEWTWGATRFAQIEAGEIEYGAPTEKQKEASDLLTANFEKYVDSLGTGVTAKTMEETIIGLMKAEIEESIKEIGIEQMKADLKDYTWLKINDDGTYTYDYEAHKYAVGLESKFKAASAFSNQGMSAWAGERNEDNLFGSLEDDYSPYNEYSWNNDDTANKVGKDDTKLDWYEFLATEDGARLQKQMKMTSPIQYLLDAKDGKSAPNWYVRYGMYDRDSSWAIETVLLKSMEADKSIEDISFEFAWLKGHSGNYDVKEAYAWLAEQLAEEAAPAGNVSFADATKGTVNCKLDGKDIQVTMYEDLYLANTTHEDQKVAIYVPAGADENSPIMLMVNNSGWQSNSYSGRSGVKNYGMEQGFRGEQLVGDYKSDSNTDQIGRCIAEGYVIVAYGCRSRNNGASEDGTYNGHSPATMSDTKAVIRYLRANADLLPAGDTEKIVVSGTSGGGALSVVIAASGDSTDYYPSLYASGAAGIEYKDGKYVSTISDAVWATIAYCPITDLGHACAAYEWTWAAARDQLIADKVAVKGGFGGDKTYDTAYGMGAEKMAAATELLTASYVEYIDSLGMDSVNSKNLKNTIIALMKAEIEETIKELGVEQMKKDLNGADWLVLNDDGTYTYDFDKHVYWVGTQSVFKAPSAFSNVGMSAWKGNMNEDNLFGTTADDYSPFNEYFWDNDDTANKVGKDDTGLTWDEYMATDAGKALALQAKMTNGIAYLLDGQGESKSAPNWYVRYGMADRDSSFAVEAVLNAAMDADKTIEDKSFEFAWLKGHSGNYDVDEAYAWLKQQLLEEAGKNTDMADAVVTKLAPKVDGKTVNVTWYADGYLAKANSEKQYVNVYVPENATEASPIMFYVNNSGWMQNNYPTNTIEDGKDYNGTTDRVGVALKEGYVVVSYGCRSRTDATIGHSPATMTDTKAVIRYLRANEALFPGDTDKIVITGTSGGGALSVIIAASGNSADYYPSLYEVGAAGIEYKDGKYTSTIRDDIFATIAYCPITDLGNACAAYDWTWGAARTQLMAEGKLSYKGATAEQVNTNAAALTKIYEEYLDGLGLETVSAKNMKDTIIGLMKAEIDESIKEVGIEQMKADLKGAEWLKFNEDGSYEYDYDAHVLWVAQQTALKISPAFSNVGTGYKEFMNEDNLFGAPEDVYSPFNEYSWSIDATKNAVGQDDTGKTWDEYMATEDGKRLALQIKMTNPIPYLLDEADGDSAPYWYVRYGMADRDSSFAVEAVLNAAMDADKSIKDKTFEFAWLKPHSGNYDVPEAYAWLKSILPADFEDVADDAWYAEAVDTVVEAGLMNGVSATEFAPKATMTRAMLATILYRMAGEPAVEKAAEFKDVEAGKWYSDAIAWAAAEGIVNGYGDGLFGTNEAVTREQFVTMLYRFYGEKAVEGVKLDQFTDAAAVSAWAVDAIEWAVAEGIIEGNPDGTVNPKGTASRAEAAVMLGRI